MLSKNKVKVINKLKSNKKKLAAYVKDPAGGLNTFWNKNDQTSNSPLPPQIARFIWIKTSANNMSWKYCRRKKNTLVEHFLFLFSPKLITWDFICILTYFQLSSITTFQSEFHFCILSVTWFLRPLYVETIKFKAEN